MEDLQIYYIENSESRGPFSSEEIRRSLQAGTITSSTLGWHKNLKEWQPIGVILHQLRDLSFASPPAIHGSLLTNSTAEETAKSHSGLGIASFIIGAFGIFAWVALFAGAAWAAAEQMDEENPILISIGLAMFAGLAVNLLGVVLGAIGAFDSTKKMSFSLLGVVFNGLELIAVAALIVLGLLTSS